MNVIELAKPWINRSAPFVLRTFWTHQSSRSGLSVSRRQKRDCDCTANFNVTHYHILVIMYQNSTFFWRRRKAAPNQSPLIAATLLRARGTRRQRLWRTNKKCAEALEMALGVQSRWWHQTCTPDLWAVAWLSNFIQGEVAFFSRNSSCGFSERLLPYSWKKRLDHSPLHLSAVVLFPQIPSCWKCLFSFLCGCSFQQNLVVLFSLLVRVLFFRYFCIFYVFALVTIRSPIHFFSFLCLTIVLYKQIPTMEWSDGPLM